MRIRNWVVAALLVSVVASCDVSAERSLVAPSRELQPTAGPALPTTAPSQPAYVGPTPVPTLHPAPTPFIAYRPDPLKFRRGGKGWIPPYNPDRAGSIQIDLRSYDLSPLDLRDKLSDLLYADFDTRTIWPHLEMMAPGFNWQRILELGKNPGLGVSRLHERGITGKGVGIGIIEQTLFTQHDEYADRLIYYDHSCVEEDTHADMHSAATASIAAGKAVGVAPGAFLYVIAVSPPDYTCQAATPLDYIKIAEALRRLVALSRSLPTEQKIRVIFMAFGWEPQSIGYEEMKAATEEAMAEGMLIVCSSMEEVGGFKFSGLGRAPLADPERFESYEPGLFWAKDVYMQNSSPEVKKAFDRFFADRLLVPMDSRSVASPTGIYDYVYYRGGGWSWAIPYIAGLYALASQVDPGITPEGFWGLALETGRMITVTHEGTDCPLGPIVDPVALIGAIQAGH